MDVTPKHNRSSSLDISLDLWTDPDEVIGAAGQMEG